MFLTGFRLLWLVNLETQWSEVTTLDKSPFRFEDNITNNEHSVLLLLINALAVFQKSNLESPKGHMETKLYYGSYEV